MPLKRLSRLSVVGLSSSAMVAALVLSLLVLDPRREAMPQQVSRESGRGLHWQQSLRRWPDPQPLAVPTCSHRQATMC